MRLEQHKIDDDNKHEKSKPTEQSDCALEYPSPRYFQVHFQYLYEMVESLIQEVREANQQIVAQKELMHHFLRQPEAYLCEACQRRESLNRPEEPQLPTPRQGAQGPNKFKRGILRDSLTQDFNR